MADKNAQIHWVQPKVAKTRYNDQLQFEMTDSYSKTQAAFFLTNTK
jgi:hypothetical protein